MPIRREKLEQHTRPLFFKTALAAALCLGGGCQTVPVDEQRLVSKPCMQFSDSALLTPHPLLISLVETGRASSNGARPTGCSACGR